jgi:hypothetical protein
MMRLNPRKGKNNKQQSGTGPATTPGAVGGAATTTTTTNPSTTGATPTLHVPVPTSIPKVRFCAKIPYSYFHVISVTYPRL